jgi:hypothetical protein
MLAAREARDLRSATALADLPACAWSNCGLGMNSGRVTARAC